MAIALNTPKEEGYKACCLGACRESNPYWSIQHMIKWDEWDAGWYQAFSENKYGVEERFIVICSECGEKHLTTEVEFLNVEEDMEGRDVMHYTCPVTNQPTKSLVYRK